MRPLSLTMQAIGPFKNKTEIDFASIGATELFLIHGATGRGKSFIFDSICFALYGETPSKRETHFKSDHAEPGTVPFVEFTFELGEARFRVRRQPAHVRPKARGEGMTDEKESVELVRIEADGAEKTEASSIRTVRTKVEDLLGLDMGQFSQVVLLPQGEFRKLLLAESADREVLLEKLFDSSWYERVQNEIGALTQSEKKKNEALMQRRDERMQLAREAIPEALRPDENSPVSAETLQVVIAVLDGQIQAMVPEIERLSAAYEKAVQSLTAAGRLKEDLDSFSNLQEELKTLLGRADEMKALREELSQARAAQALVPLVKNLETIDAELAALDKEIKEQASETALADEAVKEADKKHKKTPSMQAEVKILRRHGTELEKIKAALEEFQSAHETVEAAEKADKDASEELKEAKQALADLIAEEKKEKKKLKDLEAKKTDQTASKNQLETVRRLAALQLEIDAIHKTIKEVDGTISAKEKEQKRVKEALDALKEKRERNLAGELAQGLKSGEACPVCGSTKHPAPAKLFDEEATQEVLEEAETAVATVGEALQELKQKRSSEQARLLEHDREVARIKKTAGKLPSEKALSAVIEAENSRQKQAKGVEEKLRILTEEKIPDQQTAQADQLALQTAAKTELKNALKNKKKAEADFEKVMTDEMSVYFEEDEVTLESAEEAEATVASRVEGMEQQIETVRNAFNAAKEKAATLKTELTGLQRRQKTLEVSKSKAGEELAVKLAESPFKDVSALRAAIRSKDRITEVERQAGQFDQRQAEIQVQLKDLKPRVQDKEKPDIEKLELARNEAKETADQQKTRSSELKTAMNAVQQHAEAIREIDGQSAGILKELELLGRLNDQLNGKSSPRISLKRFFLSQRLDEVVILATRRLLVLSNGRFELKRTDVARTAAAQAGLDLCVVDNYTGTERPVNSLSGGQMFLASLSMALGLADVVQARSGGIRLDTLFIDEGFGSLDDETLQVALAVLNDLREGRMVGVISHVNELKRQISKRIEVLAADDAGSKITMCV